MKCVSILRYLSDNLTELPLSVTTRLVVTHDVPALLIWFLEKRPWRREGAKGRPDRVYQGADWVVCREREILTPNALFVDSKMHGEVHVIQRSTF